MFPTVLILSVAAVLIVSLSTATNADEKSKPTDEAPSSMLQNQVMSNQIMVNGGCSYINGMISDGNETRNATAEEKAAVEKWNQGMNQWGSNFQRSMQQQMASIFPAGFPFNQGGPAQQRTAGGGDYQPPTAPVFPCLCKSCKNAGDENTGENKP